MIVASPLRVALVPDAIAFRDPQRGVLGTGWRGCTNDQFGCRPQGTISLTTDGGKTWKVVLRTPRPVVDVGVGATTLTATFDDGENLESSDGGKHWQPAVLSATAVCPPGMQAFTSGAWLLCTSSAGAGNEGKSAYRRTGRGFARVAYTPFPYGHGGYGGISTYGYPQGIAMARDGFGLSWESRGTLYVTRDGGSHWVGLPNVAQAEVDFGISGYALPHGVGFAVLAKGGSEVRRLLDTTDAGRSWRVVHTWS